MFFGVLAFTRPKANRLIIAIFSVALSFLILQTSSLKVTSSRQCRLFSTIFRYRNINVNSLHWCLDVVFNEDQRRARARSAAKNLGTLRAICVNLIKRIPGKRSMKGKRLLAAPNVECLQKALRIEMRLPRYRTAIFDSNGNIIDFPVTCCVK